MQRIILSVVLLSATAAFAAETAPKADAPAGTRVEVQKSEARGGLQDMLDELWARLRQFGPKLGARETEKSTLVAGVRGAESTASSLEPYWKGDKTRDPAFIAEVGAFNAAQALAERGDYPAAAAAFEKFQKDYPASGLRPNADYAQALALVSGGDRVAGIARLKAFAEHNPAHPLAADAQRLLAQLKQAR